MRSVCTLAKRFRDVQKPKWSVPSELLSRVSILGFGAWCAAKVP